MNGRFSDDFLQEKQKQKQKGKKGSPETEEPPVAATAEETAKATEPGEEGSQLLLIPGSYFRG